MNKKWKQLKGADKVVLGSILLAAGIYFHSWWGIVGLLPIIVTAIDWLHGLFTFRQLRY